MWQIVSSFLEHEDPAEVKKKGRECANLDKDQDSSMRANLKIVETMIMHRLEAGNRKTTQTHLNDQFGGGY